MSEQVMIDRRFRGPPGSANVAGHWVPYERPEVVNSLIREFVD
jgi:pimeloyl-ACP methyl ester carboxylesterase